MRQFYTFCIFIRPPRKSIFSPDVSGFCFFCVCTQSEAPSRRGQTILQSHTVYSNTVCSDPICLWLFCTLLQIFLRSPNEEETKETNCPRPVRSGWSGGSPALI